jgi:hypothetical protein
MEIELGAYIYHGGGYRPVPPDAAASLQERLMETSRMVKEGHPTLFYTVAKPSSMQVCAACFDPRKVAGKISGTPAKDDRRGLAGIIGIEITGIGETEIMALSAIPSQAALAELLFGALDTIQTALQAAEPDSRETYKLWSSAREAVHDRVMVIVGAKPASLAADLEPSAPLHEPPELLAGDGEAAQQQQEAPAAGDTQSRPSDPSNDRVQAPRRRLPLLAAAALLIGLVNSIILIAHLAGLG